MSRDHFHLEETHGGWYRVSGKGLHPRQAGRTGLLPPTLELQCGQCLGSLHLSTWSSHWEFHIKTETQSSGVSNQGTFVTNSLYVVEQINNAC